jgi:RloB-like protein
MIRKGHKLEDYNKVDTNKDATKFFLIYEGSKREPIYFGFFNAKYLNPKTACILHVFENDTDVVGSQPKKLIERAKAFIDNPPKNLATTPSPEDKFRFVLDVDNHPIEQFGELKAYCESLSDGNLYISNYCFEVWLWFHMDSHESIVCDSSAGMKTLLGEKHAEEKMKNYPKGYLEAERLNEAIRRAEVADTNKGDYFPVEKSTKVYLLMQELLGYAIESKTVKDPEVV